MVQVLADDNATVIAGYTYGDSNERLIAEESGQRTYYVGEGGATTAEYTEATNSSTPVWSKSYVYLGARLLATLTPNPGTPNTELIQFHHPDRLGTRLVTNPSTGSWFEQQTLPFGTALNESPPSGGSTGATNRRFTSYDRSATTGLDYANNRHYDPEQGRFTQVDPIGMSSVDPSSPQTLNLYAYCANDPVNQVDPSGLGFFSKLFKAIGKIFKIITVALLVAAVVVMTAIWLAPASSFIFKAASWMLFHVVLPASHVLAKFGIATPGSLMSLSTPPWNPGSKGFFGNGFQGQDGSLPDCSTGAVPCDAGGLIVTNIGHKPWYARIWAGVKSGARNAVGGITASIALSQIYYQRYDAWMQGQTDRFLRRLGENSRVQIGNYPNGEPLYMGVPVAGSLQTVGELEYSVPVLMKMEADPLFHGFPNLVEREVLQSGSRQVISPNYVQYTLRGSVNGRAGTYEIGINPATKQITHRFFRPN